MGERVADLIELFPGGGHLHADGLQPVLADEQALALGDVDGRVGGVRLRQEVVAAIHVLDDLRHGVVLKARLGQRILVKQLLRDLGDELLGDELGDLLRIVEDVRGENLGQHAIHSSQLGHGEVIVVVVRLALHEADAEIILDERSHLVGGRIPNEGIVVAVGGEGEDLAVISQRAGGARQHSQRQNQGEQFLHGVPPFFSIHKPWRLT